MKTVKGDLIKMAVNGDFDIIIHGCNIHCTMASGIAATIAHLLPEAYEVDLKTNSGDWRKLGNFTMAKINGGKHPFTVVNLYTQGTFGRTGVHVDYAAVERGLYAINLLFPNKRIGIPKIGCGLGGGDWDKIVQIIERVGFADITYVEYEQND